MKKATFALCDYEVDFANNFIEYFLQNERLNFDVLVFYSVDEIEKYLETRNIDLMLITNSMLLKLDNDENIGQIIVLSEGEISKKYSEYPVIFKYQRTDKIISELLNCYAKNVKEDSDTSPYKSKVELIGVYSPVKRCKKTSFSLGLSQILAESKSVLYMNLEEYSGLLNILGGNCKGDILDLIYFERQKSGNCILKLKSMVSRFGDFDYLEPAKYTEELKKIEAGEWVWCFEKIMIQSGYERIIIDCGEIINGIIDILNICTRVYMPIRTDFISLEKVNQFEDYIDETGNLELKSKIQKVLLPDTKSCFENREYFENISKSDLGEAIRDILMGD